MVSWTSPLTWSDDTVVDEDDLNEQIRDNLLYLYASATDIIYAYEEQTGDASGSFTSGGWRTRVLNQLSDPNGIASLSSNRVTIPAGSYLAMASAPAGVNTSPQQPPLGHQIRLQNITAGTTIAHGTSERIGTSGTNIWGLFTRSFLIAYFTLSVSTALEIQHQIEQTPTGEGFGSGASFSNANVYAQILLRRVKQ